ncbi:MAG: PmoA family protein [Bacteroidales bacterium]
MKRIALSTVFVCLLILIPTGILSQVGQERYNWEQDKVSLMLKRADARQDSQIIWTYHFDPRHKPFFHPVYSLDGILITSEAPADHPWHLGLWFCWKYINGLNYWEYQGDPKLAVSEGRTNLVGTRIRKSRDGSARITQKLLYHPWERKDQPVMKETRTTTVTAPRSDRGYLISIEHQFTALTDVLLDRTPAQTNAEGIAWGGYAGLSIRFDGQLSSPRYFSAATDSMKSGERAPWVSARLVAPDGRKVQVTILEDPGNPGHPTPWYCINRPAQQFWFYSPAILYHEALALKAGEKLVLRYRVMVAGSIKGDPEL